MKRWFACLPVTAVLLGASHASAENTRPVARLQLGGSILGYESLTFSGDELAQDVEMSTTTAGLMPEVLGVGVGAMIGDFGLLGLRAQQGTAKVEVAGESVKASIFNAMVYAELLLAARQARFKPYFAPMGGPWVWSTYGIDVAGIAVGGEVGAHIFATDTFSIDPAFSLLHETGTAHIGQIGADVSGTLVLVSVSFSGWLGQRGNKRDDNHDDGAMSAGFVSSPPARRAADREIRARHGVVSTSIRLDDATITVCGRAERGSSRTKLRLTLQDTIAKRCKQMALVYDNTLHDLHGVSSNARYLGFRTLEGEIEVDVLRALAAAPSAELRLCQQVWSLRGEDLAQLYRFTQHFAQPPTQPLPPAQPLPPTKSLSERTDPPDGTESVGDARRPEPVAPAQPDDPPAQPEQDGALTPAEPPPGSP